MKEKQPPSVFVLMDHICEADLLIGVFSTREKAQSFLNPKDKFYYEGPEIIACIVDEL